MEECYLNLSGVVDEMELERIKDEKDNYEYMEMSNFELAYMERQIPDYIPEYVNHYKWADMFRNNIVNNVGFCLVAYDWVRELATGLKDKKCLEIMAGSGALSKALQDCSVDIICTDSYENESNYYSSWKNHFTEVENIDAMEAIEKYGKDVDYIICAWPPYNESNFTKALNRHHELNPNSKVIYIGEEEGGCTADDTFFEQYDVIDCEITCKANDLYHRWSGIHDTINLMVKKN